MWTGIRLAFMNTNTALEKWHISQIVALLATAYCIIGQVKLQVAMLINWHPTSISGIWR